MNMGYYRFPTIHNNDIVFVSEDDLWRVSVTGGVARRLTSNLGEVSQPWFSPTGENLAFVGRDEGRPEIYVMPADGGPARRLTYMGSSLCLTCGWNPAGEIIFASNAAHWYLRFTHLYAQDLSGSAPKQQNLGLARAISFGPTGGVVIGRFTEDPARWKRYRGGTAGQIWIDRLGTGEFQPLLNLPGNLASPLWLPNAGLDGRIYFISDHQGTGNLYSVLPSGADLQRHTHHRDFYARHASSDGRRIVYQAGAELFVFDPASGENNPVAIEFHSSRTQRNRKYVETGRFLKDWNLHPNGQSVALSSRGKLFSFSNWEGAVTQHGGNPDFSPSGAIQTAVRYRLPGWLNDGKHLIAVTDEGGEEQFIIFSTETGAAPIFLTGLDIGRPEAVAINPCKDQIVFSNHRYEILFLDLATRELRLIDRGQTRLIEGFSWSPDGEWLVYSISVSLQTQALKLWQASTGEITQLTRPVLRDIYPTFDPKGKYIYFISYRSFDPVYDNLHFDLGFPMGMRPYLITLLKDLPSPFIPQPPPEEKEAAKPTEMGTSPDSAEVNDAMGEQGYPEKNLADLTQTEITQSNNSTIENRPAEDTVRSKKLIQIDLDGIQDRVLAFPINDGIYGRIHGLRNGKVFYLRFPLQSALDSGLDDSSPRGAIFSYSFDDLKEEQVISGVEDFSLSQNGKWLIYRSGQRLRVVKAGEKPTDENGEANRKNGWLDLNRVKVAVLPGAEWSQMYREAWRLQRDQFWTPDMSQVDWLAIYDRYFPLVERVNSRAEFSDLMWEMQGELGTSHAYEFGGDYRPEPHYLQGFLGAEFSYADAQDAWLITQIHQGDSWNPRAESPLRQPGINVQVGDALLEVNGQPLSKDFPPGAALVNLAANEVALTIRSGMSQTAEPSQNARRVTVKALGSETALRYREWVERNRATVHQATSGQAGYVHIPDMMGPGYAEFHRGYLAEVDRPALIIDVRFNRGGHVSALLLEKLARRRLGYDQSRWSQLPNPYPPDSISGPMVAITNEFAGSDGDIFSHGFKLMKLGLLIGKRTWGGVIGIEPRHFLVDGTITTQPEFSFWFNDIGWGVENYGTDPDIEVDITPQDYAAGVDAQLDRAIAEIRRELAENPPTPPDFSEHPDRSQPRLPA